jgi:antitoxin Phd
MSHPAKQQMRSSAPAGATWRLEEAKARFSEVVRRARTDGPQRVTVRGQDAVVVIAVEELARLLPPAAPQQPLAAFLQGLGLREVGVERERDLGRDGAL